MTDPFFNVTFGTLLLAIAVLLWAVFELRNQRDFWKEQYCVEMMC